MRFFIRALSLAVAAASFLAHAAPLSTRSTEDSIAGRYIVQLKPDVDVATFTAHREKVRSIVARHLGRRDDIDLNAEIDQEYSFGDFKGYAGAFDAAVVAELEALDDVFLIEKDFLMYPTALVTRTYKHSGAHIDVRSPTLSSADLVGFVSLYEVRVANTE